MSNPELAAAGSAPRLAPGQGHEVAAPQGNLNERAVQTININRPEALDPMIKRTKMIYALALAAWILIVLSLFISPSLYVSGVISNAARMNLSFAMGVVNIAAICVFFPLLSKYGTKRRQLQACRRDMDRVEFNRYLQDLGRNDFTLDNLLEAHSLFSRKEAADRSLPFYDASYANLKMRIQRQPPEAL